jgi:hypothetical protein
MEHDNPSEHDRQLRGMAALAGHAAVMKLRETKGPDAKQGVGPLAERYFYEALAERDSSLPPLKVPKKLAVFIAKWTARMRTKQDFADAKRTGRPCKIPAAVVDRAVHQVWKRYQSNNPYKSLADAAHSAYFKHVLKTYDTTIRTLWRRMCAAYPSLHKRKKLMFKHHLSQVVMDDRVAKSVCWLQKMFHTNWVGADAYMAELNVCSKVVVDGTEYVIPPPLTPEKHPSYDAPWLTDTALDVVWIDAKTVYIEPQEYKVWTVNNPGFQGDATHDEDSVTTTSRTPNLVRNDARVFSHKSQCIKYYAAVSARHGPILLKLVSGTHGEGYTAPHTYMVGGCMGRYAGTGSSCP